MFINNSYLISSLTPLLDKKFFILFQDVSCVPINLKTPSKISLITSGGARKDRISDKESALILPTAALAASINGFTSESSSSISSFLN